MFVRIVDSCQSPVPSFYVSLSRSPCKYEFTHLISSCFSYNIRIISWCSGSQGGWCLPQGWDWWWSCPLSWWRRGWQGLTGTGWRRGRGWLCSFSIWRGRWSWWRCWCISNSIYQVFPLSIVNSEVFPQLQRAILIYCWDNESNVLH